MINAGPHSAEHWARVAEATKKTGDYDTILREFGIAVIDNGKILK